MKNRKLEKHSKAGLPRHRSGSAHWDPLSPAGHPRAGARHRGAAPRAGVPARVPLGAADTGARLRSSAPVLARFSEVRTQGAHQHETLACLHRAGANLAARCAPGSHQVRRCAPWNGTQRGRRNSLSAMRLARGGAASSFLPTAGGVPRSPCGQAPFDGTTPNGRGRSPHGRPRTSRCGPFHASSGGSGCRA